MTDDIVTRLRERIPYAIHPHVLAEAKLLSDAIKEIEELRKERDSVSDIYEITKRGRFHWELAITDRRWGSPPFYIKRYWTKRSAERTVRWHRAYRGIVGRRR